MNKVIIKFGETFDKIERDILSRFGIRANARRCGGVAIPGCKVMIWWPNPFNHDKWVDECILSKENRNECMVITDAGDQLAA